MMSESEIRMKFKNEKEMYDFLMKDKDLYSPEKELYIFRYNQEGSLCYYGIENAKAVQLAKMQRETGEYWGAELGAGGHIIDPEIASDVGYTRSGITPLQWLKTEYQGDWYVTDEYTGNEETSAEETDSDQSYFERLGKTIFHDVSELSFEGLGAAFTKWFTNNLNEDSLMEFLDYLEAEA